MSDVIPLPPPELRGFVGGGDFLDVGREFLDYFVRLGGLKPHHRVLDVGCGIGRMAVPLTGYLTAKGSYEGIDVWADGVRWCRETITPRFPNFRFRRAEVYNGMYNPGCPTPARAYAFPFPDRSFDIVVLTSVFTHLLPPDLDNYLCQVQRVLRRGGRCLATFFLLTPGAWERMAAGRSKLYFPHRYAANCMVGNDRVPEGAVAYSEWHVLDRLDRLGLVTVGPVRHGRWSEPEKRCNFQDIIVFRTPLSGRVERWARRVAPKLYGRLTGWTPRAA